MSMDVGIGALATECKYIPDAAASARLIHQGSLLAR
jgi:hypothetical protein